MNGARVRIHQIDDGTYATHDGNFRIDRHPDRSSWRVVALTTDAADALMRTHAQLDHRRLHQALEVCRSAQDWLKTDGTKGRLQRAFERAAQARAQREAETTTARREPGQEGDRHESRHDDQAASR